MIGRRLGRVHAPADYGLSDAQRARRFRDERDQARNQVAAALAIHAPVDYGGHIFCQSCVEPDEEPTPWPCPTAVALGSSLANPERLRR